MSLTKYFVFQEELNLLAKLIGTKTEISTKDVIKLNMFDIETDTNIEESERADETVEDSTLNINVNSSRTREDLNKIISEMTVSSEEKDEDDLLSLMDKAS